MFLPEETSARLFILYPPGARGDFLAAILNNTIADNYEKPMVLSPLNYQKTHWIEEIIGKSLDRFEVKIRIKLVDLEDFLTVTHLCSVKIRFDQLNHPIAHYIANPKVRFLQHLIENEQHGHSVDHMFDHVVDFKSLFKIKQINKLYRKINNQSLDNAAIECIQHNISLQSRATITYV
jgi:tetrahydromethanopterin S-methyltransferase subunit A